MEVFVKRVLVGFCVFAAIALAGCGGGGGGGGGGGAGDDNGGIDPNTSLIGTWLPVSALEDGNAVRVSTAMMSWDAAWTRGEIQLLATGVCTVRGYINSTLDDTISGTWSSDAGVAPIVLGGVTTTVTWENYVENLVDTADFTRNGHNYQTRWVRVVSLAEHEAQLIRTGTVASATLNGASVPVSTYFGMAPQSDNLTLQLLSDGTMWTREVDGHIVVTRVAGTWATGGGEIIMTLKGEQLRGIWEGATGATLLDPDGDTLHLGWGYWAPGGTHPSELLGTWRASGVKEGDTDIPLADFFEWEAGVTRYELEFWADGAVEQIDYAGSALQSAEFGDWSTIGNQLTINLEETWQAAYSVVGSTLTATIDKDGHTYVLTLTKVS
jgi:hypothetical protein